MNKLGQNLLIQLSLAASQIIFSLLTYPVVAQAIGAEGLGSIVHVDSFVQFVTLLFSLGIPIIGVREIAISKGDPQNIAAAFSGLFSLQLAAMLPAFVTMLVVGLVTGVSGPLLVLSTVNVVASCLTIDWYYQGLSAFRFVAIRTIGVRILTVCGILTLVNSPQDLYLYYGLLVGSVLLNWVLNFAQARRLFSFSLNRDVFRSTWKRVRWIYAYSLCTSIFTLLDVALVDLLAGKAAIGFYSFAYKLVRMSSMFILTAGAVFIPNIALHHARSEKDALDQQVKFAQTVIYFLGWPVCVMFLILAPELVAVLGSADFFPSVRVFQILWLVPMVVGLSHLATMQLLVPRRKERPVFWFVFGGALLSIGLNVLLIPTLAAQGAALTNFLVELAVLAAALVYLHQLGWFRFHVVSFFTNLVSALFIVPVVLFLRIHHAPPVFTVVGGISIAFALHICAQWFLFPRSGLRSLIKGV